MIKKKFKMEEGVAWDINDFLNCEWKEGVSIEVIINNKA